MSDYDATSDCEYEMVSELLAEGFGDPLPRRLEPELVNRVTVVIQVTVAAVPRNEAGGEVPEGVPFQVEAPEPPTTDFALWRCQLNDFAATLCTETFSIDRNMYRVFTTPLAGRLSYHYIPLPIAHF